MKTRNTSKRQDRKLKAICFENRKCTMKNKWAETGVNTVKNDTLYLLNKIVSTDYKEYY